MIVFSQGYDISVDAYLPLLRQWASAGFVVAAPEYPYTSPGGPLDEADIINHPYDLRFAISSLLTASKMRGSAVYHRFVASEIGIAGHSDGGDVSLVVAAGTCCRDSSVKAAAILSGAELASFGGSYFSSGSVPMLVTQGNDDTVNVPACSAQIYDAAPFPKFYLDLLGALHQPPYTGPGPWLAVVARVTSDFFAYELAGLKQDEKAMISGGQVRGVSQLVDGPVAPPASGYCPGA